jgi:dUTPase
MSNFPYLVDVVDENHGISPPVHEGDVGYDVVAASEPRIVGEAFDAGYKYIDYIEYDLNIKLDGFQPVNSTREDVYTLVFPRSSVSKYNLVLANSIGVIDSGYRNTLKVRFKYIMQPEDLYMYGNGILCLVNDNKIYQKGDKICQLVFQKHFHPSFSFVSQLEENTERNQGGFGSTNL